MESIKPDLLNGIFKLRTHRKAPEVDLRGIRVGASTLEVGHITAQVHNLQRIERTNHDYIADAKWESIGRFSCDLVTLVLDVVRSKGKGRHHYYLGRITVQSTQTEPQTPAPSWDRQFDSNRSGAALVKTEYELASATLEHFLNSTDLCIVAQGEITHFWDTDRGFNEKLIDQLHAIGNMIQAAGNISPGWCKLRFKAAETSKFKAAAMGGIVGGLIALIVDKVLQQQIDKKVQSGLLISEKFTTQLRALLDKYGWILETYMG
jgi:hypothetical protein